MIKKFVCLCAIAASVMTASCKKEASEKIDDSIEATLPASPDAVIAPEPNISATAPESQTAPTSPPADGKYAVMSFDKKEHDFGTITEGDQPSYTFKFVNTGSADLIITNAKGSCGCTVPEYPKTPVKPGESGKIKVSFNSSGKNGQQRKTVTITANTLSGKEELAVKASIQPKTNS